MTLYTGYTSHRGKILLSYRNDAGLKKTKVVDNFRPSLFIPSEKPSTFKSTLGGYLEKVTFENTWEARQYAQQYEGVSGFTVHGYSKFDRQFVREFLGEQKWSMDKIRVAIGDIETEVDGGFPDPTLTPQPIYLITIHDSFTDRFNVFSVGEVKDREAECDYHIFSDEKSMLNGFLKWWDETAFDVFVGFNSEFFDLPYMVNRINMVLGSGEANRLSPFGILKSRSKPSNPFDKTETMTVYSIVGIEHIDWRDAYIKFANEKLETYSLDFISYHELNAKKLEHESGIKGHLLYKKYYDDAVKYNVQDVRLLRDLDRKKGLLALIFELAYMSGMNYSESFSPVRMWESIIYKELAEENIYFPYHSASRPKYEYDGGYVKDPIAGKYEWVVSNDVTSEYPSLIMALNISPETILNRRIPGVNVESVLEKRPLDIPDNLSCAANGQLFSKETWGFMARVTKKYFALRKKYKDEMLRLKREGDLEGAKLYNTKQNAIKVALNSLYGAAANEHFHFFDIRIAEAITLSGQAMIRWIARDVNKALNRLLGTDGIDYCIAIDTDSNYFNLGPVVAKKFENKPDATREEKLKFIRSFADGPMQDIIKKSIANYAEYLSCYEADALSMKRECVADAAVFIKKKRYLMNVLDTEGVEKEELKMVGVQAVQSSTPMIVREKMKQCFAIMLHGKEEDIQDFTKNFRDEFKKTAPEKIAPIKSVNYIKKFQDGRGGILKGAPYQTKAAIAFNEMLVKHGVEEKYEKINENDKIKLLDLTSKEMPVLGFKTVLPREFSIDNLIDYDTIFDKTFAKPIDAILQIIGWNIEKKADLSWF